jgi:MoaA/NifB/PqqE/SkfB family radical SAM enzyme
MATSITLPGGKELKGPEYKYIYANGTPVENGQALKDAYAALASGTTENNTLVLGPGSYNMNGQPLTLNKRIDIVGLTDNAQDVRIQAYNLPYDQNIYSVMDQNGNASSFSINGYNVNNLASYITLANGDKIVEGNFSTNNLTPFAQILRIAPNGTVTPVYNQPLANLYGWVQNIAYYIDSNNEEIIIINTGQSIHLYTLSDNNLIPNVFTADQFIEKVVVNEHINGKDILIQGYFGNVTGSNGTYTAPFIAKLNVENGTVDNVFLQNIGSAAGNPFNSLAYIGNIILLMGYFTSWNGASCPQHIVAIGEDGIIGSSNTNIFNTNLGTGYNQSSQSKIINASPQGHIYLLTSTYGNPIALNGNTYTTGIIKLDLNGNYIDNVIDLNYFVDSDTARYSRSSQILFLRVSGTGYYNGTYYEGKILPYSTIYGGLLYSYFQTNTSIPSSAIIFSNILADPNTDLIEFFYSLSFQSDESVFIPNQPCKLKNLYFGTLTYQFSAGGLELINCLINTINGINSMSNGYYNLTLNNSYVQQIYGMGVSIINNSFVGSIREGIGATDIGGEIQIYDSQVNSLYNVQSDSLLTQITFGNITIKNSQIQRALSGNNGLIIYKYCNSLTVVDSIVIDQCFSDIDVFNAISIYNINHANFGLYDSFKFKFGQINPYSYPNSINIFNCSVPNAGNSFTFDFNNLLNLNTKIKIKNVETGYNGLSFTYTGVTFNTNSFNVKVSDCVVHGNGYNQNFNEIGYISDLLNKITFLNCLSDTQAGPSFCCYTNSVNSGNTWSYGNYINCTSIIGYPFNGYAQNNGPYPQPYHVGSYINCFAGKNDNTDSFKNIIYLNACSMTNCTGYINGIGTTFLKPTDFNANGHIINGATIGVTGNVSIVNY